MRESSEQKKTFCNVLNAIEEYFLFRGKRLNSNAVIGNFKFSSMIELFVNGKIMKREILLFKIKYFATNILCFPLHTII